MIVTRFAPSPTGYLHLGHAFAAFNAWKRARTAAGRFLLRIEDIDQTRCRPDYAAAIQEDLAWLGLDWDGPVRVQSQHMVEYQAVLDGLAQRGLIYPCFCTRASIMREITASAEAQHGPTAVPRQDPDHVPRHDPNHVPRHDPNHVPRHDPNGVPLYPGTCRRLSGYERARRVAAGETFGLRLDMAAALRSDLMFDEEGQGSVECHPERFGDVILARKDTPASYHLCVTHDDAVQGVTLVTRALDLKPATDLHRLLQAVMGWPVPTYAHHPLLTDASGKRLSKRDGAVSLRSLRADGVSARAILQQFDQSQ